MKAAITILGGGDKKTIQPGEEIPEGYFSAEELESAKAAGVIEGEGPNAGSEGPDIGGPVPAQETAEAQAAEKLSPSGAAKASAAKAESAKEGSS